MYQEAYPVMLKIDPSNDSGWYKGGLSLLVGNALLFNSVVSNIVLQSSNELVMKGIGFDVYLDTTTTACFIDFTKYAITVINSTIIICNIDPAIMLSIGTHYVSFEIDHISLTPQEFEFLVLPN